jgi:GR25 family glycosyltransferase involved in LPS biosynthesis
MPPVRVISLERSAERRAEFRRRNPQLDFAFFDAVDGASLTPDAIAASGLFQSGLTYTAGAYGVALSHHALWEDCIRGGESLTVAEDDAVFREDFSQAQQEFLGKLQPGWDFVLWGWNFDSMLQVRILPGVPAVMGFDPESLRKAIRGFPFTTGAAQAFRLDHAFGLPAYTISPAGAKKFKTRCFPLSEFSLTLPLITQPVINSGIDAALNNVYAAADCYAAFPPLVATENDQATSTIQNGQYLR